MLGDMREALDRAARCGASSSPWPRSCISAARRARLHMTQPPLTQAIAQLGTTLGVRLFDRTRRSVALTPAGEALLPRGARAAGARAGAAGAGAGGRGAARSGALRLAFVSTIGFELLPAWVRAFRAALPAGRAGTGRGHRRRAARSPRARRDRCRASCCIRPASRRRAWSACASPRSRWCWRCPASIRWRATPTLSLAAVLAEPLVIFPRRIVPSLHDAIFGLYHAAGRAPRVAQEAIQMQTIVNLVSAGLGVAWVPESVHAVPARRRGLPPARRQEGVSGAPLRNQPGLVAAHAGTGALHGFGPRARSRCARCELTS